MTFADNFIRLGDGLAFVFNGDVALADQLDVKYADSMVYLVFGEDVAASIYSFMLDAFDDLSKIYVLVSLPDEFEMVFRHVYPLDPKLVGKAQAYIEMLPSLVAGEQCGSSS